MDEKGLLSILQTSIALDQQYCVSFVYSQLSTGVSVAIANENKTFYEKTIDACFASFEIVENNSFKVLSPDALNSSSFSVAIPFCEKLISTLHFFRQRWNENKKLFISITQLDDHLFKLSTTLQSLRNRLYRKEHIKLLGTVEEFKLQPAAYESWFERFKLVNKPYSFSVVEVVDAVNSNQLTLLQGAAAATVPAASVSEQTDAFVLLKTMSTSYIYQHCILPAACQFLQEGRAAAAADVLMNLGRDAAAELTIIANRTFDWRISENAICFLGEIDHLPVVDAVSLYSSMSGCFSTCPCDQPGMHRIFSGINVPLFSLDPVLKFYCKGKENEDNLAVVTHDCRPIPFPFEWIQQLTANEKRQIHAACHAIKESKPSISSDNDPSAADVIANSDMDIALSKANFEKLFSLAKVHISCVTDFIIRQAGQSSPKNTLMPSFVKHRMLHIIGSVSSPEQKALVEPVFDLLPFCDVAEIIACSASSSCEHLITNFGDDQNQNGLLPRIANVCCQKTLINLFLCLVYNKSLNFAEIISQREDNPFWADFFGLSKSYFCQNKAIGQRFVEDCVRFVSTVSPQAALNLSVEKVFLYFLTQLLPNLGDNAEERPCSLLEGQELKSLIVDYSPFLSALFEDGNSHKLEDAKLLYTLLRSNMVFDVTKLFRFQTANYLATEEADECITETFTSDDDFPPSFLRTTISSVPSRSRRLPSKIKRPEPVSFLGFGRPLRAVLQHILSSGKYSGVALTKLRGEIEKKVFNLAIENADNASMVASCILFLNILGFPAEQLQCAICILRLCSSFDSQTMPTASTTPTPSAYSPVTFCKLAFFKPQEYASEIENICLDELTAINYDLYSSVLTLAVLDRLASSGSSSNSQASVSPRLPPAWSRVLISLATSNNWLNFFTYAQVLQIEPADVLQLASWFSDPHLKSHVMKTAKSVAMEIEATSSNETAKTISSTSQQQQPRHRRSMRRRRAARSRASANNDTDDSDGNKSKERKEKSQAADGGKRGFKSSLMQREQDLLPVVLQVAASLKETRQADEETNEVAEFEALIDAVYRSKNPVCAIYAACLPKADRLVCLVAYFCCYFPEIENKAYNKDGNYNHLMPATSNPSFDNSPALSTLATVIDNLSVKKAYKTLFDGFTILLPSCPLSKLFKAAVSLANQQNVDEFKFDLNQFTLALEFYDNQLCSEMSIEAIASIAGQFLARFLYQSETISLFLIKMLEIYCQCRVAEVVTWPLRLSPKQLLGLANQMILAPDDSNQKQKIQQQPIAKLLGDDVDNVNWSLIGELQSRCQYIRARLVGQLLGISLSAILLKEFKHRYSCIDDPSNIYKLVEFWKTFATARRQSAAIALSNDMLLDFLQALLDECCRSPLERTLVAYEISRLYSASTFTYSDPAWSNSSPKTNIFLTFYSNFLQYYCDMVPETVVTAKALPASPATLLFNEYFEASLTKKALSRASSGAFTTNRLLHCRYDVEQSSTGNGTGQILHNLASSEVGQAALRVLLDDLLEHGYIADALLLNKLAGNRSSDLLYVKQCTDLVWGRMGVSELPPPYCSSTTVQQAMERMASDCESMKAHIERLLLYYSISVECSLPYAHVETTPALMLCEPLLRRATYTALELIAKLVRSGDLLAPEDYAILVCDHVVRYWASDFDAVSTTATDRPVGLDEMASRLFQLCPDQTVVGNQLVQGVSQILSKTERGFHELSAAVDILVHAHNAFALSNNVDGIASTLHLARKLSGELEQGADSHLQLLVKLLHNIGRYGEMSYVLDILFRNGKLPLVFQLRPRPDCEAQFRTSLLEFLRGVSATQSSSNQPDLYRHVCLQYGMEREVAQLLFDSASTQVSELGKLANTVDLNTWAAEASNALPSTAQKFVDAAKGYARAECPNQAEFCIRQARILALQLRFLAEGTVSMASAVAAQQQHSQPAGSVAAGGTVRHPNLLIIIGRSNPEQIRELVIQQSVAFECLIISEAYKVDYWPDAVFRQVVVQSKNSKYFHDLMAFYTLTDRFFEELIDITERFNAQQQQAGNQGLTPQQASRLKRVLHYCPDWTIQYGLAGGMGFSDLQLELVNSQATPYIKDLLVSNKLPRPSSKTTSN